MTGNVPKQDKGITLDTFREIAKKSKDVEDFMSKVKEIKNVPPEVAKEFSDKYGKGKSMKDASLAFMNDVKSKDSGISDKEAIEALKKNGYKSPTNAMIEKKKRSMAFEKENSEKNKVTEKDKKYFKENKKELMDIINDDPFISIREAVKEHKESKIKKLQIEKGKLRRKYEGI